MTARTPNNQSINLFSQDNITNEKREFAVQDENNLSCAVETVDIASGKK